MITSGGARWAAALLALFLLGATTPPSDPLVERQYHLERVRAYDGWSVARGKGQVIAVLDTGVALRHPDLRGRLVDGVDLVDPGTRPRDRNGHGTFVAGVAVAAADNGEGGAGVAPRAKVMPVRVLDDEGFGSSDVVAEGIRWATRNGATVINLSLADVPGQDRPPTALITTDVELAIRRAALEGVVVVAAAGNDGADSTPYSQDLPALIVGATNADDGIWKHSNYDDSTLFAPGVDIVSTYVGDPYAIANGTSFATPVVAAGAALLLQQGMDADDVRQQLLVTARPVDKGAGRVDIGAALGVARPDRTTPQPGGGQPPEPNDGEGAAQPEPVSEPSPLDAADGGPQAPPADQQNPAEPQPVPTAAVPPAFPASEDPTDEQPSPLPGPQAAAGPTEAVAAPLADEGSVPLWVYLVAGGLLCFVALFLGAYLTERRSTPRR